MEFIKGGDVVNIIDNVFEGNLAKSDKGGVIMSYFTSYILIDNCKFL